MPLYDQDQFLTTEGAFQSLTLDDLRPLARLLGQQAPLRKSELVAFLTQTMTNPAKVRALYESLDETAKAAVQEAVHDPEGKLDTHRFHAKYNRSPNFGSTSRYDRNAQPTPLRLVFPHYHVLPRELQQLLSSFVPEPRPITIEVSDQLPAQVQRPHVDLGPYHRKPDEEEVDLQVRETARAALHDIKAVLRLIDAGEVKVSDKTRRPTQAAMRAIPGVLADGDFYTDADRPEDVWGNVEDLTIKPFAWPMLVQAAGLAQLSGTKLQLTPAGRKATTRPAHEVIRQVWEKWLKSTLLDEFNRVSAIKGQQGKGKGGLTSVAPRRQAVLDVLEECPVKQWLSISELFRLLQASAEDFYVSRDPWRLYLGGIQQYGSLGYDAHSAWETLQGRFVLAFLMEYAATLGLVDVAYISPFFARNDYRDRWGTDDLYFLSRYDGLMFIRINALGAWCLGLAEQYEPEPATVRPVLTVLPNLDVVAGEERLSPADVLFLDRFGERKSEAVWHLNAAPVLTAVEEGLTVAELKDFLAAKSREPLPQTVEVFLTDLQNKAGQLKDLGTARLLACADPTVAQLLATDRQLRKYCQLAGDRQLVFRAADEAAVRRGLRERGYVLPPAQ
jgi:hypothetical protein